jgi:hypothetical protein
MKLARCISAGALALLLSGPAGADDKAFLRYPATVVQTTAEVRSGPSEKMGVTNRLGRGDKVIVVGTRDGGWLAIEPPEGSFSWINERYLKHLQEPRIAYVETSADVPAPVLVGSLYVEGKPTVRGTEVKAGTILWTTWEKMPSDEGNLIKIAPPPPSEVRYIRSEAVSTMPITTVSAAPGSAAPAWQPANPSPEPRPGLAAASPSGTAAPAGTAQPASPLPALSPGWSTTATGWLVSPPGRLTLADHRIDDQEGYLLLNSQGIPLVYATARSGYTLRTYLDKNLELRGVRQWREDLRAYHMTVMEVRMVP